MGRHGWFFLAASVLAGCGGDDEGESVSGDAGGSDATMSDSDASSTGATAGSNTGASMTGDGGSTGDTSGQDSIGVTGDTSGIEPPTCGESNWMFNAQPSNVVLVLDKSGSMMELWDDGGADVTRWSSLHGVVSAITTNLNTQVNFGAKIFPRANSGQTVMSGACEVNPGLEVPIATLNAQNVVDGIPGPSANVRGGTPAAPAMQEAIDALLEVPDNEHRVLILVTDGAANCAPPDFSNDYDFALNDVVEAAYNDHDMPTYVVGIDIEPPGGMGMGFDLYEEMNTVAELGGRPKNDPDEKFYSAADPAGLLAALQQIAGQLPTCTVPLDPEPLEPMYVEITVGDEVIDYVASCDDGAGWTYVNPDGPYDAIEFCGAACDTLQLTGTAQALYGCPPQG